MSHVRVFAHANALLVSHVRNVLAAAGIPVSLRNMVLGGGAGAAAERMRARGVGGGA